LPISSLFSNLVDFLIASFILIGLMVYYNFAPNLGGILLVPLLVAMTCIFAVGLGFFLASLNVKYRDIKYILPFFVQLLLFVTPVIYPPSILGDHSWVLALNPMTGIIKAMRAALFGGQPINWFLLMLSATTSLVIFLLGLLYFKKTEKRFADLI
jgi:lipopolysaccharide transport system permease protein